MSHCTDVFSATCFISGHTVFAGLIRRDLHMRSTRSANDAATLSISGGSDPEGGDPHRRTSFLPVKYRENRHNLNIRDIAIFL